MMHEPPLPPVVRWLGPLMAAGYGLGLRAHRALTTAKTAPLPVICIGNITTGGTGKTPAVKYFARELCRRGHLPAVLMRGYKEQGSDEAVEIENGLCDLKVPVILGADRSAGCISAKEKGRDVALMDDGFQHWALRRDLDIVLIDATDPFGGGHLLPWGRLREQAEGVARAGIVLITRADAVSTEELEGLKKKLRDLAPQAVIATSRHRPVRVREIGKASSDIAALKNLPLLAACGIGNPHGFKRTLSALGANILECVEYPDHYAYRASELEELHERAKHCGANAIVVTEKDAVKIEKLAPLPAFPILVLEIAFEIIGGDAAVWEIIDAVLKKQAR